jgi:nitrogen fixation protein FixH
MTMIEGQARLSSFELKGWHVLLVMVLFFGTIFVANAAMLHWAVSTFRGTETDSAYREGLAFNRQLAASRRQDALGWTVNAQVKRSLDGAAVVEVEARDRAGLAIKALAGQARLAHPADKMQDRSGDFVATAPGRFVADVGLVPHGQWDLIVDFSRDGERIFLSRNRIELK